jgi:cyclophilin family peptidyl-prolyl cis-trans isomerase
MQQNLLAQVGDPTGTGQGGACFFRLYRTSKTVTILCISISGVSVYGKMYGDQANTFADELSKKRKLDKVGMVCMAKKGNKEDSNTSQFFITLR